MRCILFLLAACEPTSDKANPIRTEETDPPSEGEGEGETASPPPNYDVTAGVTLFALPWAGGEVSFGGYAGVATESGFWTMDGSDGEVGHVYRLPWATSSAASIEGASDLAITTGVAGAYTLDEHDGWMAVSDGYADVGDSAYAGVTYQLQEPEVSGAVADLATVGVQGGWDEAYVNVSIRLDADLDGEKDDLVAAATDITSVAYGRLAVFLDIEDGVHAWGEADFTFPVCTVSDSALLLYGPADLEVDASGDHLWVACPSRNYADGKVERFDLPLRRGADAYGGVLGVDGASISADPRGGVWAGSRGYDAVIYVFPDLLGTLVFTPAEARDVELFGAHPQVIATRGGQHLLVVGDQAPAGDPEPAESGVWLCDVSVLPESAEGPVASSLTDCGHYTLGEGGPVTSIGAVQDLVETDAGLFFASTGWELGVGGGGAGGLVGWVIAGEAAE